MALKILVLISCFLGLQHYVAGRLNLAVNNSAVTPTLTKSLNIDCTFYYTGTNFDTLVSLTISKSTETSNPQNFVDLVTIDQYRPDEVTENVQTGATVSGLIGANRGDSHLSLAWTFPSLDVAGFYRCIGDGLDSSGQPVSSTMTAQVTSQNPDMSQLTSSVTTLDSDSNDHESRLTILEGEWDAFVDSNFDRSSDYNGRYYLASRISWGAIDIAQAYCEFGGGYLAEINDAAEHDFLRPFLETTQRWSMLIGIIKDSNGVWRYRSTNQEVTYFDWHANEPNQPSVYCMTILKAGNWQMQDYPCTMPSPGTQFLCEIPY